MALTLPDSNQVVLLRDKPLLPACSHLRGGVVSTVENSPSGMLTYSSCALWGICTSSQSILTLTSVTGLLLVSKNEHRQLFASSSQ